MEKLVKGFLKFRTEVFGKKKELFTRLSENQTPRALSHPEDVHDQPAIKEWVGQAETTRRLMREHYTGLRGNARLIKTTQENVRSQLDHLCTHPSVALQLRNKTVDIHGWV